MLTVFSFKLASIEVWKQSISSQGCIFGLEFKPDGTSWRKSPCEICHCEVGLLSRPLQKRERTGKEYSCFPFL